MKPLRISDGSLETLKWIALVLMTGDHVNKYLFNATLPLLFEAGRVALPLFVFVLAYNLARPDVMAREVYGRTMKRLALFGAVASVPFILKTSVTPPRLHDLVAARGGAVARWSRGCA